MEEKYWLIKSIYQKIEDNKKSRDVYNPFKSSEHLVQYRYWDGKVDAFREMLRIIEEEY